MGKTKIVESTVKVVNIPINIAVIFTLSHDIVEDSMEHSLILISMHYLTMRFRNQLWKHDKEDLYVLQDMTTIKPLTLLPEDMLDFQIDKKTRAEKLLSQLEEE